MQFFSILNGDAQGVTYDSWLTLSAMLLRRQRMDLGTMVSPLPSRLTW